MNGNGIRLVKQGNANWLMIISPALSYSEFEACMKNFLSSLTAPQTVIIQGQKWTFADLSNQQARMLLYQEVSK